LCFTSDLWTEARRKASVSTMQIPPDPHLTPFELFLSELLDPKWIVTFIVAAWGAALSTYTAFFKDRWQRKTDIRVRLQAALIAPGEDVFDMLSVTVANHGQPKASFGLNLAFKVKDFKKGLIVVPDALTATTFPVTLEHGQSYKLLAYADVLAKLLKKEGLSGTVEVSAVVSDNLGREHVSRIPLPFPVEHEFKGPGQAMHRELQALYKKLESELKA
jgi:hypothetical protein